jgi:hypothetical protein
MGGIDESFESHRDRAGGSPMRVAPPLDHAHGHGRLAWSVDIAKQEIKNLTEVQVDAKTGKIAALQTEIPPNRR